MSLFIRIARTFLQPFVVSNLKFFEGGLAEVTSGTTVIPFNSQIATHAASRFHRYSMIGIVSVTFAALAPYSTMPELCSIPHP